MPLVEVWPSAGISLKGIVVSADSAYPGFGSLVTLKDIDHQKVCKPVAPTDRAYAELRTAMRAWLGRANAEEEQRRLDAEPECHRARL